MSIVCIKSLCLFSISDGRQVEKSEGKHRVNTCFNRLGESEKKIEQFLMVSPAIVALGTAKEELH